MTKNMIFYYPIVFGERVKYWSFKNHTNQSNQTPCCDILPENKTNQKLNPQGKTREIFLSPEGKQIYNLHDVNMSVGISFQRGSAS